ncbi:hypothetical protein [Clostridium botulinum]|uniref:hypothetical protein n=1 Tax=Clostridium botulinum TaxID=1491 RepID=UPI00174B0924|nr:hypothetical protein [Clostridium botulinum]MBD5587631.1 hypothetical protein [Clostridium botulinum]
MEKSGFFNAMKVGDTWDRVYKAETYAEYFASFIGNGVFPNPSTNLQVIGTDKMQVIVKPGKGWINGYKYENTDDLILPIDVADGVLHRIDKIVLRYDVVEREIRAKIKKGEFASEPKAPQLTRDADMYELGLADIKVNAGSISITQVDITDLRLNKEVCGIVHGTIDQVDTTTIFNQYLEWYKNITGKTEQDLQDIKGNLETDFNIWFNGVKNILSGDVAGNLLNLINKNKESIDTIQNNVDEKIETVKSELADITTLTGNKDNLKTINKTNLVSAINEVFTSGNNVKFNTVDALLQLDKSLQITKESKWEDIIKNISKVSTGKKWAKGKIDFQNEKLIYELKDLKFIPQNIFIFINMYGDNGRSDYDSWFASTEEFKFNLSQYARNNISNLNQYLINVKIENNGLIITIPNEFYSTPKGICIGGIYFFITE